MIVNVHAHIGESRVFDHDFPEQPLVEGMDKYGIDVSIVQPAIGHKSYKEYHDDIADAAARHPGRIAGMTAFSPHIDRDEYFAEVERCVKDLGFVGIKLHPLEMAVDPLSEDGRVAFEAASAFDVPLMVHTGVGAPFAGPSKLIPRAREFPHLPIIMAHAGLIVYTHEAMVAAELCQNLYLEPSWCSYYLVNEMIEKFGSERVMVGGDHILNFPIEKLKIELLELSEGDHCNVMGETARRVFKLDERMKV
jgi:hypothetical protein